MKRDAHILVTHFLGLDTKEIKWSLHALHLVFSSPPLHFVFLFFLRLEGHVINKTMWETSNLGSFAHKWRSWAVLHSVSCLIVKKDFYFFKTLLSSLIYQCTIDKYQRPWHLHCCVECRFFSWYFVWYWNSFLCLFLLFALRARDKLLSKVLNAFKFQNNTTGVD